MYLLESCLNLPLGTRSRARRDRGGAPSSAPIAHSTQYFALSSFASPRPSSRFDVSSVKIVGYITFVLSLT